MTLGISLSQSGGDKRYLATFGDFSIASITQVSF